MQWIIFQDNPKEVCLHPPVGPWITPNFPAYIQFVKRLCPLTLLRSLPHLLIAQILILRQINPELNLLVDSLIERFRAIKNLKLR